SVTGVQTCALPIFFERLAGKTQYGCDERAIGECGNAVERHVVRRQHAANPGGRWGGAADVELECFHRLSTALVGGIDGIAAVRGRTQTQAVEHCLLRIERTWTARVPRLVSA